MTTHWWLNHVRRSIWTDSFDRLLASVVPFSFMSKFVSRAGDQIDQLQEQLTRRETNEERGKLGYDSISHWFNNALIKTGQTHLHKFKITVLSRTTEALLKNQRSKVYMRIPLVRALISVLRGCWDELPQRQHPLGIVVVDPALLDQCSQPYTLGSYRSQFVTILEIRDINRWQSNMATLLQKAQSWERLKVSLHQLFCQSGVSLCSFGLVSLYLKQE
jgi:hypothetical protein